MPPPPKPVPLHHEVHGDAKALTLVLIHGFPYDGRMWKGSTEALVKAGYRVVVPDLRGFGRSAIQPTASMAEMAADVSGLLETLGVRRAVIVGFSMGGYVALQMAIRHADQVAGLVLVDTRAEADSPAGRTARLELAAKVSKDGLEPLVAAQLPKQTTAHTNAKRPEVARVLGEWMRSQNVQAVVAAMQGMADRPDVRGRLAGLGLACLVISGEEDQVVPLDDAVRLAQHFRGSVFEAIPKAAHAAPLEDPDRFHRVLLEWLKHTFVA
jgi:pimeloyl-ACP methyl ester carboxylesterase